MQLGEFLKNARILNNLSQRELAKRIKVDNATISRIEKGVVKRPAIMIVLNIALTVELNYRQLILILSHNNYSESELLFFEEYYKYCEGID